MSTESYNISRLRDLAERYETTVPLGWQEVQGIHKFLDHLDRLPEPDAAITTCPLCGMTRAAHQPCPYCGC
jgi:hypothetical protein